MSEILRRMDLGIYDKKEYEKELKWIKANCKEGKDWNGEAFGFKDFTKEEREAQWEFVAKMTLIVKDIMLGNPKLDEIGWHEEALGRNAILGGFQGQRMWTDYKPNGDFTEAILNSTFDWNGKREPITLATENDGCNGLAMLFGKLLTGRTSIFADVRTFWSPTAVERVTGWKPEGLAENGFMHLINSGAAAQCEPRLLPRRRLFFFLLDAGGNARHDGTNQSCGRYRLRDATRGRLDGGTSRTGQS